MRRYIALAISTLALFLLIGCGDGGNGGKIGAGAGAGGQDAGQQLTDAADGVDTFDEDPADTNPADSTDAAQADAGLATGQDGGNCPGASGCTCVDNADCDNSICLDTADGRICATTCVENCAAGFTCKKYGKSDATFVCIPNQLTICAPCKVDADCQVQQSDALCLDYGPGGKFCGGICAADSDCPTAAYACVEVLNKRQGLSKKQCKLKQTKTGGGDATMIQPLCACSAWAKSAVKSTVCTVSNDQGSCTGSRACGLDGLTECDAVMAAEETCNGVDDNCDGVLDNLPASVTCTSPTWLNLGAAVTCTNDADCPESNDRCAVGTKGGAAGTCERRIGACAGTPTCVGGELQCHNAKVAKVETCNGDDDDCDGDIDETFTWLHPISGAAIAINAACGVGPCVGGVVKCESLLKAVCTTDVKSKTEGCDGVDNDCDGKTDDGVCDDGSACTADVCDGKTGVCSNPATVTCDDSNPCTTDACDAASGTCTFVAYAGSCDDGDACTVGDVCGSEKPGKSVCKPGSMQPDCDDSNPCTDDSCAPATGCVHGPNAVTETCYDGASGTSGTGTCRNGTRYCKAGAFGPCLDAIKPTTKERCDGLDDTCDGVTDEGCKAGLVNGSFAAAYGQVVGKKGSLRAELSGESPVAAVGNKKTTLRAGFMAWLQNLK